MSCVRTDRQAGPSQEVEEWTWPHPSSHLTSPHSAGVSRESINDGLITGLTNGTGAHSTRASASRSDKQKRSLDPRPIPSKARTHARTRSGGDGDGSGYAGAPWVKLKHGGREIELDGVCLIFLPSPHSLPAN
ncbi:hypothetical protein VPH35_114662 [Triticum aestivum]